MLPLTLTTDKISINTELACDLDVAVAYIDRNQTTGAIGTADKQLTNITTATTTDVVSSPGASTTRNIKTMHIRNANVTTPETGVTMNVQFNANGTLYELYRGTLYIGDSIEYAEGVGFTYLPLIPGGKLNKKVFFDRGPGGHQPYGDIGAVGPYEIPGLKVRIPAANTPLCFEAHIYHLASVATVGMRLEPGIIDPQTLPAGSFIKYIATEVGVNLNSVTASSLAVGTSNVSTTQVVTAINGPAAQSLTILTGHIQHTTATHIVMRVQVDVAVATGLSIIHGSWLHVWEPTG